MFLYAQVLGLLYQDSLAIYILKVGHLKEIASHLSFFSLAFITKVQIYKKKSSVLIKVIISIQTNLSHKFHGNIA